MKKEVNALKAIKSPPNQNNRAINTTTNNVIKVIKYGYAI